jgi:hypothetical protein
MEHRMKTEYAAHGGSAAALSGLAEAAGLPLSAVCELAVKGELMTLFRNGETYRHRAAPEPPRSPRHAQIAMWRKRLGPL